MSLTMNMIGGGGGISGNRAVLVARVPSGSTVTATKDGVTLTPTMWVSETYPNRDIALFVFSSSQFDSTTPWTITATDGTRTKSGTVLITTNREYEITLSFEVVLYDYGVYHTTFVFNSAALSTSVTDYATYVSMKGKYNQGTVPYWRADQLIDFAQYSAVSLVYPYCFENPYVAATLQVVNESGTAIATENLVGSGGTVALDIASVDVPGYVQFSSRTKKNWSGSANWEVDVSYLAVV